ncbi:transcription-repair coupling factor [Alloalcanivorax gelatiniphagus]|uniref:Transcription-repair-coupling factor n=1 Tax=Alloalcanivorax gelatiniphagus TaxID=1194167 RepID=A0ABY2XP64_9GAMM|nr:transcription-repair coupling factor [Alloalcanivorax gelatiniphagus]TMW14329.1 transcription-repair coupling factor [Alloalcanivorax gelatiniphagus]
MTLLPDTPLFPAGNEHFKDWRGLSDGSLAAVLTQVARSLDGPLLVAAPGSGRAQQLADALGFYLAGAAGGEPDLPVMLFPDWETLPYDLFSPHQDIVSDRIRVLNWLGSARNGVLVVPINTLMQRLAPPSHIAGNSFMLRVGEAFDMETTRARLVDCGYRQRDNVYEHGEFAVRGAIMDVFPMGTSQPFRVELFDDDIESLRLFDPETQRSTGQVTEINLLPAAEYPLSAEGIRHFRTAFRDTFDVDPRHVPLYQDVSDGIATPGLEYYLPLFFDSQATLFDYLPANARALEMAGCEEAASHFWDEVNARYEQRRHDIYRPVLPPARLFLRPDELDGAWKRFPRARQRDGERAVSFRVEAAPNIAADPRAGNPLVPLHAFADARPDLRILVVAETAGRREALLELMQKIGIQPALKDGWADFLADPQRWNLTRGELDAGFHAPDHQLLVVSESELYGERVMQRRRRRTSEDSGNELGIRSLGELSIGAPVVHLDHGVGRYQGLVHMAVHGQQHEFLLLEYAGGDKLYVPVSSLHLISRYGGGDSPPLNRLGTEQWTKARQKAAEKINDVAAELLNTYARREARQGRAFGVESEDYERFASGFPFEETPDQEAAIRAVISDMQLAKPMDRLVCGDVGFGKTEVAMRAAFVAVQTGAQVAVLVPTTLLAQQHYESFVDRFADWPVNIEVLSRFRSAKDKSEVLARLKAGKVDIIVGTHQLLQESVSFSDLGLIIVDEEHRFGVRHKERLKELRAECDILTLTATPIPRTLNMAMSGMRDISIIATPPQKRLSVKTFVQQKDSTAVKEAILRELLRGGQVYYLHNDIDTMARTAEELRKMVPDARVGIAHGQMRERELEAVMSDFYHRRFNVLVCTTIIETGIDVPSANTIVIERADKLGLAQLHQLRGRVGRSHHQAYAYLITPSPRAMTKDALKRLEAIEQATDLGAGFVLASQDLEIRGAGELLGEEQHGNMEAIGFSLYMEMLEQAVEALKRGEQPDTAKPLSGGPEVNLRIPALIPEDYLPDVFTRLSLYKRIAGSKTVEQLEELQVEMIDRFGLLPDPLKNLFHVTALRQRAERLGITRVDAGPRGGKLEFAERTPVDPLTIVKLVQSGPNLYKLEGASTLRFSLESETAGERIGVVEQVLERLSGGGGRRD